MTLNEPGDGTPVLTVENGAEFTNSGTVTWNGGTIRLEGSAQLVNEASGEFAGSGTIEGSVLNAGVFQVGASIDSITVTGKYTQLPTGELRVERAASIGCRWGRRRWRARVWEVPCPFHCSVALFPLEATVF